ncbi:MAG TPA: diacylglycerol kinase [Caldimonas sp.]|nr:diacylglycerol kinase [Caldimonas sp.]
MTELVKTARPLPAGLGRLVGAFRNSIAGLRHAVRNEAAFRQELIAAALLFVPALVLPVARVERLVLILSMLLVMVVELLNSAIEATVDRIGPERHPLSGLAKDLGSAAVAIALVMSIACWVVIAGPTLVDVLAGAAG